MYYLGTKRPEFLIPDISDSSSSSDSDSEEEVKKSSSDSDDSTRSKAKEKSKKYKIPKLKHGKRTKKEIEFLRDNFAN